MKRSNLFFAVLALLLVWVATSSTRAQSRIPQHLVRERGVRRVRAFDGRTLSVVSQQASDQYLTNNPAASIPQSMKVDLFDGTSVTVNVDRVEQQSENSRAWYGKIEGSLLGSATFVRSGNSLIGSVSRGDGIIYQVRTEEDGTHWLMEIDQTAFPSADEEEPISSPPFPPPITEESDLVAAQDDGSIIDVMVVYTPAARVAAGGATQIQQLVQLGIAETNAGYSNSGVIQRVRLVYSGEVTYSEAADFSTDLDRLSNATDGFIDEVATLRNTYGADLVSLWRAPNSQVCGLGWVLNRVDLAPSALSAYGFTVVAQDCATGYYSFGHEMGHNMGADHAKDDNAPHGPFGYGSGYKQTTGTKWRTIMAYDGNCSCPRINYFSNPTVLYNGLPAGIDPNSTQGAANYQVLNNTRTIVANFRSAITGGPPADATGPQLLITSHSNNQTVSTGSITIAGTATDSGRGDNGISSVTVNGVRASGDTATGSAMANWSRTITLSAGANTITVIAKDNSAAQNSTALTITVNFGTPTSANPSPTASTYHVFPQFADGRFADGSSYRTTVMIANPSSTSGANCTMQMRGFTVPGFPTSYTLGAGGWVILPTSGTQNFVSGYATLSCSANVEAQVLYSYYAPNGVKLSEATVFSSPAANALGLTADERDGGRFAIAIANDTDRTVSYSIYISASGFSGSRQISLNPRSSIAGFLSELVSGMPGNTTGAVTVVASSTADTGSVIGLRYTGGVFTTMPASAVSSVGPTASTYHIFPQFADGRFGDGTYYRTSRLFLNPSTSSTANCTTLLRGMTTDNTNSFSLTLPANSSFVGRTNGTQTFQSGYATLSCTGSSVYAQAVYSLYDPNGVKASEATVFSSPSVARAQVLADNREGARVGIAIANDSDQVNTYTITAYDSNGTMVGSTARTLQARASVADFLDNWIPGIPANYFGQVIVQSTTGGTASVIGLRFTGAAFTTIPATVR
jgi:peptidyl-Asp metalloendopeptidase